MKRINSEFKSTFIGRFCVKWLVTLGMFFSLGLAGPWLICYRHRYMCAHTYINGRRQRFDGKGNELCKKYYLWYLFCILTFGIYTLIIPVKIHGWLTEHTHFEAESKRSSFSGKTYVYALITLATSLVSVLTLGIGSFWMVCIKERFLVDNAVIDGKRLRFTGKGSHLFAKGILWYVLSIITLGIYSFFLAHKQKKWLVYHTELDEVVKELNKYDSSKLKAQELEKRKSTPEWQKASLFFSLSLCALSAFIISTAARIILLVIFKNRTLLSDITLIISIAAILSNAVLLILCCRFADKSKRPALKNVALIWAILIGIYLILVLCATLGIKI